MTINECVVQYVIRKAGGKRVKTVSIENGSAPPKWHYEQGWTRWKNGVPKHYTRSISDVTVGKDWLIAQFPVQWATARLAGNEFLAATSQEIKEIEVADNRKRELAINSDSAKRRTSELAEQIRLGLLRGWSLNPEEDARCYA